MAKHSVKSGLDRSEKLLMGRLGAQVSEQYARAGGGEDILPMQIILTGVPAWGFRSLGTISCQIDNSMPSRSMDDVAAESLQLIQFLTR